MYDAIVVGARCSGSPAAMLLARLGYRVLLVDRATFPSDSVRGHVIFPRGVARLKRWGVLQQIIDSNCPPIHFAGVDAGAFAFQTLLYPVDGVDFAIAPRRYILDSILVDAAVEAGVELREGFNVDEILMEGQQVVGIRGRTSDGEHVEERARIVIGADGHHSIVARSVQAPTYHEVPTQSCLYYSYWSGMPVEAATFMPREDAIFITFPTNDNLTAVAVTWPISKLPEVRSEFQKHFFAAIDTMAPELGARMRAGKQEERFLAMSDMPSFYRKSSGPGWALVGDAGFHKDPILGQGLSDAFRDVETLVAAIDAGFQGRQPLDEALAEYEQRRDEVSLDHFHLTCQFAAVSVPPEVQQLMFALSKNDDAAYHFLATLNGAYPVKEFFAPENIGRIMAGVSVAS